MMFGVQEALTIQESYTIWHKSMLVYSIYCIECNCLQPLNELNTLDKYVIWIAIEPS